MSSDDDISKPAASSSTIKGVSAALLDGLPFAVGSTIAGKYRIDRVLGAGGMGVVLAGRHLALDQRVAIKVLKPNAIDNPEFVARFDREARASARLRSEHVARVLDVGRSETGLPYMVMEYLSGKDLSAVIRDRGPLPVMEAADYVMQACEGLAEAHRAGIVHRDLKPANLFLTKATDGTPLVKVLDFGISKMLNRPEDTAPSEGLTQTQSMIGSPHYMSPEQLKSARDVDARTDIWSLGGVLFKLLTNEPAFEGGSTPELCVAILVGSPRDLRKLRPDVPDALVDVVLKCLHKDPSQRYATVTDLARALVAFAPPHSASSVERIARVGSNPHMQGMPSEPPRSVHGAKSASGGPPTASTVGEGDALASGGTVDIPMHVEMHTLTSSASSLSSDGAAGAKEPTAPKRSARRVSIAIGAIVALVAVAAGVRVATRSDADTRAVGLTAAPPPSPSAAPPPLVDPDPGAPAAPVTAPMAAHPATGPASPPPSSASPAAPPAVGHAPPPRVPGARTPPPSAPIPSSAPRTAAAVTTAAPVPAPPPPPPPAAGTSSADFGGRK